MSNIIMRYEDYLIHTKHASDNTVASYMRDLRQYASYLGSEGIDVLDADQDVVSGYMNIMKANGKSAATISRALASIKSLYIFAVRLAVPGVAQESVSVCAQRGRDRAESGT